MSDMAIKHQPLCYLFLNCGVHHVGLRALPGLEEVVRFPRPAGDGDQSSTGDPDASFRAQRGTDLKISFIDTYLCICLVVMRFSC